MSRPTEEGFYFVDYPDDHELHPTIVQITDKGEIFTIGCADKINAWPDHLLQNWRKALDERSLPVDPLLVDACARLNCGGDSLLLNIDVLRTDVGRYDQICSALREIADRVATATEAELRTFVSDLRELVAPKSTKVRRFGAAKGSVLFFEDGEDLPPDEAKQDLARALIRLCDAVEQEGYTDNTPLAHALEYAGETLRRADVPPQRYRREFDPNTGQEFADPSTYELVPLKIEPDVVAELFAALETHDADEQARRETAASERASRYNLGPREGEAVADWASRIRAGAKRATR